MIDEALLRPGRFDYSIKIELPNEENRLKILKQYLKNLPYDKELNLNKIIEKEMSGAEIENKCREAALKSIRNNSKIIKQEHFL
jgi:ATP-dependent 26S proteasome regulatory subunit